MNKTIKSKSHLNHPKKSIPGTAPRKKMDYFKENIILVLEQFEDGLFQRKYYISNHDVIYPPSDLLIDNNPFLQLVILLILYWY